MAPLGRAGQWSLRLPCAAQGRHASWGRLSSEGLDGRLRKRADGDEVLVTQRSDVRGAEGHERLCPARSGYKLDLIGVRGKHLYHGADVSSSKADTWQVMSQCDCVEQLVHDYPGKAVMNRGTLSPVATSQMLVILAWRPFGPRRIPLSSYF